MSDDTPSTLAAVDLGSNGFKLLIAHLTAGEPVVVDRLREQVQLAHGLDAEGQLTPAARKRALACLDRFGQRLRHSPGLAVRAVATNTLRVATNAEQFLVAAEEALGHPIEVISGQEEARLIYLGIAHSLADDVGSRLVVDIGGGSTELILGERFELFQVHSLHMGSVAYTKAFFADGAITPKAMKAARTRAARELLSLSRPFQEVGWDDAVGSSGTARTCEAILVENGWALAGVNREGLERLQEALLSAGRVDKLSLPGLKEERRGILAAGVAILAAVFDSLGLEHMDVTAGALREGVLYDQLGRIRHEDVRERTIGVFQQRYHIDRAQAARVERTAQALLDQVAPAWDLPVRRAEALLSWAARLHEVGLALTYRHHHRHGGYILAHADMPGFSRSEQRLLAVLVAQHRRKLPEPSFNALRRAAAKQLVRKLTALLRLSVVLNRSRAPRGALGLTLSASGDALELGLPAAWLAQHPLTRSDLEDEARQLRGLDLALTIREV